MRIIINEIKKIFNFRMVFILLLGSLFMYQLYVEFYIDVFPNGSPNLEYYNIEVKMIENYGNEMDEEEFVDFKNSYKEKLKAVDEFISNKKEFNKLGVYSYEDYEKASLDAFNGENEEFNNVMWENLQSDEGTIFWELQTYSNIINDYETRNDYAVYDSLYKTRLNEIIEKELNKSILGWEVFGNYNDLIRNFAKIIIVGIAFMLTPLFLSDRRSKVEVIQYTSRWGRKIFNCKIKAGFISAFIITTLELAVCFILYRGNNTGMFWGGNLNSVLNQRIFWFDLNFLQYIILTIIAMYILSMVVAAISMFISSKANTYVAGIGIQVVIVYMITSLAKDLLMNELGIIYTPKYLVIIIYLILIIIGVFIISRMIKKEPTRDILN